jgi:hypothetical protein
MFLLVHFQTFPQLTPSITPLGMLSKSALVPALKTHLPEVSSQPMAPRKQAN